MAQAYTEAEVALVEVTLQLSRVKALLDAAEVLIEDSLALNLLVAVHDRLYAASEVAVPLITHAAEEEHMRREEAKEPIVRVAGKIAA